MIIAVNIGNTHISLGVFKEKEIVCCFRIATDVHKTFDEYSVVVGGILSSKGVEISEINRGIIASVVPQITDTIKEVLTSVLGITPIVLCPGVKTGFPIRIDNPSELGADLVANAAAVVFDDTTARGGYPAVIIDMGTATTIFALNRNKEYIGGCIFPGVGISFEMLRYSTALIPNVAPSTAIRAIGKNTKDSVSAGVMIGHAIMLDGFIDRFAKEMKLSLDKLSIYATGEYAESIIRNCEHNIIFDKHMTLKGLARILNNNQDS